MNEIEVWVLMDEYLNYVTSNDIDKLEQLYDEQIKGASHLDRRTFKITLKVPIIKPVELTGIVPAESSEGITLQVH